MLQTNIYDEKKSNKFSEKLVDTLNQGALSLMLSIGHRSGLFDAMAGMDPATSEEIAEKAGLNERYVREWLGSMVTGDVVEYDPDEKSYFLPQEHSAWLSRNCKEDNIAIFAQYISQLGSVEDQILNCFINGGGVPYSSFKRFHEIMEEDSGQSIVPVIVDKVIPLMDGMKESLIEGINVLDVGCGRGKALLQLAKAFPDSNFTGYDISNETIDHANKIAVREGVTNLSYEVRDVSNFQEDEKFSLILALDAIHDQANPGQVLKNIYHSLSPQGKFMMQDISGSTHVHNNVEHPLGTLLYTISCLHCMTVSLAQGGEGLGAMWGVEKAQEMLRETGFTKIDINNFEHDIQNSYFVVQK
ncbi:MAG: class I SAM-dependent methyltransferase [Nitrospinales bacterium]